MSIARNYLFNWYVYLYGCFVRELGTRNANAESRSENGQEESMYRCECVSLYHEHCLSNNYGLDDSIPSFMDTPNNKGKVSRLR